MFHRRLLLELWAICGAALVLAILGPFGTYTQITFGARLLGWTLLLIGAYIFIRPSIIVLRKLAQSTELPVRAVTLSGVLMLSAPLAMIWRKFGRDEFSAVEGYLGLMPFSVLCALAVLAVAVWSGTADARLRETRASRSAASAQPSPAGPEPEETGTAPPALLARLSPEFNGAILALESEDHYVRVHGEHGSELVLVRLRDAIAEMEGVPGEQVHRSWWVAEAGIAKFEPAGRTWKIYLANGIEVAVARDSVTRLQKSGFLSQGSRTPDTSPHS